LCLVIKNRSFFSLQDKLQFKKLKKKFAFFSRLLFVAVAYVIDTQKKVYSLCWWIYENGFLFLLEIESRDGNIWDKNLNYYFLFYFNCFYQI
jgi:hypothetical protein